jgi:archaellum component FlaC
MGNTDIEDSLRRLDNLTQEEAKMAPAGHLKIAHTVEGKVMGVDERVKEAGGEVQSVSKKVEDVNDRVQGIDNKVQRIDNRIQGIDDEVKLVVHRVQVVDGEVKGVGDSVQGIHSKLDDTNRLSSLSFPTFSFRILRSVRRKPTSR